LDGYTQTFDCDSILILLAGLISAIGRQVTPGGTDAFNLGVDFQGGTLVTAKFRQKPSEDEIRAALQAQNAGEAVIQSSLDKPDEVLIKVPLAPGVEGTGAETATTAGTENRLTIKLSQPSTRRLMSDAKRLKERSTLSAKKLKRQKA
jgi:preprotein translocase subunit SecF